MKQLALTIVCLIGVINVSNGQTDKFGVSFGIGNGSIMKAALDGAASYDLNAGISIGIQYERKIKKNLHFQTGINWYDTSYDITPHFYPGIDISNKTYDLTLIYIPAFLRIDFSKYIFINVGILGDIDISKNKNITNQTGIGAGIGVGTELFQSRKFSVNVNPYLYFHGVILFNKENYPERLIDAGIQFCFIVKKF